MRNNRVLPTIVVLLGMGSVMLGCALTADQIPIDQTIVDGGPNSRQPVAVVTTTDFTVGSYATVDLTTNQIVRDIDTIHSDAFCRYNAALDIPFVINRLGSDSIHLLDSQNGFTIMSQYKVQGADNLQDMVIVSADRAYATALASSDLWVINPRTGAELQRIDLTPYADGDGIPEAAGLLYLNGKIYVTLQRLDNFTPTDYSSVLVVDAFTGTVETEVRLTATNPITWLRYHAGLNKIILVETGHYNAVDDGGIEYLDPLSHTVGGLVLTEASLGGNLIDALILNETEGYAIVAPLGNDQNPTSLVRFNPATGQVVAEMARADGYAFLYLALTPDGRQLWMTDRTENQPGIRVFDTQSHLPLTTQPIDVGLPPSSFCFVASKR